MRLLSRHQVLEKLREGVVIPAHPLALTPARRLDERRQRALTRYYLAAGAGGVAVAVHTTQFEIRKPQHGLLEPVLSLAAEVCRTEAQDAVRIAGICGQTRQAVAEAELAARLDYDIGLVDLSALPRAADDDLVTHCRSVAEVLPIMGFYLQPSVGGRVLSREFWYRFCEIEGVVAIKIAPFNRYQTLDVIRAVAESGRAGEVALYTGNDDHIVGDLVTPFEVVTPRGTTLVRIVGGLLGQWAVWTRTAVELFNRIQALVRSGAPIPQEILSLGEQLTEANQALFDPEHGFAGCIPGIHEALRRVGLLAGRWCLDPRLDLSPGQEAAIDQVWQAYPHLRDDAFVAEHLGEWLR